MIAIAGLAPRALAKTAAAATDPATPRTTPASFTLRSDARAVSRRADSV